jgi:glycosyltransferase involved in cell wall biosynthesis
MVFERISLLIPTRNRLESLNRLLDSLLATTSEYNRVELVFKCDDDDTDTQTFLRSLSDAYFAPADAETDRKVFRYRVLSGPRLKGYVSLPSFYNQMAAVASGDLLMCANDDMVVETHGWDTELLNAAARFPDGIFNLGVRTGLNDGIFPFSVVSRRLFEAIGYINDERLIFLDIFLHDVFRVFNRAIPVPSVLFSHQWAGWQDDQTRQEAHEHELRIAYAGNPSSRESGDTLKPEYRQLHRKAVSQAIRRLCRYLWLREPKLVATALAISSLKRPGKSAFQLLQRRAPMLLPKWKWIDRYRGGHI